MDHKRGYETQDSGNVSEVNSRSRSSTLNEAQTFGQNSQRSSLDSGISTLTRKNDSFSRPVDPEHFEKDMDHKRGYETQDSGNVSEVNSRSRSSTLNEAQTFGQNSQRSSLDSGISTPTRKNDSFSRPVDPEELKTALDLQLYVTGPSGILRLVSISTNDTVDTLIERSAVSFGLGKDANVHLSSGNNILQRGTNQTVRQTNLADKSNLQLVTSCFGG